jgi:hypothetical protein
MKFVFPILVAALALSLQGCSATNAPEATVNMQTDAKGRLVSTWLVKSSGNASDDAYALKVARENFLTRVKPIPNETYNQNVAFIGRPGPLFATKDKSEADAKAKPKSASGSKK